MGGVFFADKELGCKKINRGGVKTQKSSIIKIFTQLLAHPKSFLQSFLTLQVKIFIEIYKMA